MTLREWIEIVGDLDYKRVASDTVDPYWVSTVWLGIDHGFDPTKPPLIFETMVFLSDSTAPAHEFDVRRYATEEEAVAGHEETVALIRATTLSVDEILKEVDPKLE